MDEGFLLPHILIRTLDDVRLLIFADLIGVKEYFIVALISISLITEEVEKLFMLLAIYIASSLKCFFILLFFIRCLVLTFFYILDIDLGLILCLINIFFPASDLSLFPL